MHLLVLEARYYEAINDDLLAGVDRSLKKAGATYDVVSVPGSYELPAALNFARQGKKKYDGYVLLGCVIRGATSHYDLICESISFKFQDLAVEHSLALGFGVLTCENYEQAEERADPTRKNYGGHAAEAALKMIALKQQMAV
jgi:6,7-dimethyl-8-ribityllumazine synthase